MTKAFAYYNEIDPFAAEWLRNLIRKGLIADGEVDERSIEDVTPGDLLGFSQCHFFAGIGVWSRALRLAGWPDDRPVWTGSCPCQPFSAAGKRDGFADERHLWPAFFHLIEQCRPSVVFGEQVASKDGLAWLDLVSSDLEGAGYAVGAADLCAAGVGAPHIRQRLWWVAYADECGQPGSGLLGRPGYPAAETDRKINRIVDAGGSVRLADADGRQLAGQSILRGVERDGQNARRPEGSGSAPACRDHGGLEHAKSDRRQQRRAEPSGRGTASRCSNVGLADANDERREHEQDQRPASVLGTAYGETEQQRQSGDHGASTGWLDDTASTRHQRAFQGPEGDPRYEARLRLLGEGRRSGGMADSERNGSHRTRRNAAESGSYGSEYGIPERGGEELCGTRPRPTNGFWRDADWLFCRDGKWRPVEPGTFPLAHGAPARVGRLRAYGNAIVASVAQIFIEACLDAGIFDGACHEAIEAGDAEHV